jgi:hypothetical protein
VDESEQRALVALKEDPDGLRLRLPEADREQLDFLLGLFATGGDERRITGVARAVAAHLLRVLPSLGDDTGGRRLRGSAALLDDPPELQLAARYSLFSTPETASRARAGSAGSSTPAEVFQAIAERLLAEPSVTASRLCDVFGPDADHPDLIRLRAAGREPVLPAFQFDSHGVARPLVLEINRRLGVHRDPWGVADWWLAPNMWLSAVPAQLLERGASAQLIAAAGAVREED